MKKLFGLLLLIFVGVAGWRIGGNLSSDAIGMGVGVLLGVLAGIPTALLVLASSQRRDGDDRNTRLARRDPTAHPLAGYSQPPVIVITGQGGGTLSGTAQSAGQHAVHPNQMMWQGQPAQIHERRFRIVGEQDGWIEE